jgi:hypothetical protein
MDDDLEVNESDQTVRGLLAKLVNSSLALRQRSLDRIAEGYFSSDLSDAKIGQLKRLLRCVLNELIDGHFHEKAWVASLSNMISSVIIREDLPFAIGDFLAEYIGEMQGRWRGVEKQGIVCESILRMMSTAPTAYPEPVTSVLIVFVAEALEGMMYECDSLLKLKVIAKVETALHVVWHRYPAVLHGFQAISAEKATLLSSTFIYMYLQKAVAAGKSMSEEATRAFDGLMMSTVDLFARKVLASKESLPSVALQLFQGMLLCLTAREWSGVPLASTNGE